MGPPGRRLRKAGCRIESYQRLRWYSLARLNNRTHRELLVVDGKDRVRRRRRHRRLVGVSASSAARHKPWRDTMARIEGPVVAALQGVAAENWLECCGEILTGPEYFPDLEPAGDTTAFVDQELAVGSRHRLARDVPAADGRRRSPRSHQHAVLPAGSRAAARAGRDRAARRRGHGDRAGPQHRSALGPARQPPDVGTAARGRRPHLRIPRRR